MAFIHGSSARIYTNGYNLSSFLREITHTGTRELADTTTFTQTAHTFIPGLNDGTLSAGGLFDGDAGATNAILSAAMTATGESEWTYLPYGDTLGNYGFGLAGYHTTYEVSSPVDDVVSVSAEAQSNTGMEPVIVHHALGAETVTGNSTSVDGSASTANGGVGYLQVTDVTGTPTSVTIKIQHSSDNVTFADYISFTAFSSGNTSERKTATGTVNRYTRARIEITGGTSPSITYSLTFGRK